MPGLGERVGRDEIYGKAGDPAESLRIAMSVFGEPFRPLNDAIAGLVETGQNVHFSFTLKLTGDNPQELRLELNKGDPTQHATIFLEGDWPEDTGVPSGTPHKANYSGKFYLINPISGEPFVKPNDWIPPEGRIGTGAIGKANLKEGSTWGIRVPGDIRRGVKFLGYAVTDGQIVKDDTVLYYFEEVKKVEEVK